MARSSVYNSVKDWQIFGIAQQLSEEFSDYSTEASVIARDARS